MAGLLGRKIGSEGVRRATVVLMGVTWITAIMIFNEVVIHKAETYIKLWTWVLADIGLQYDGLTAIMLVVVTSISWLVHIYSTEYMSEDPHLPRFMSYLSLFTWFMLILVTADNLIQLFIGWEGVGLCSYLLINYWYTRQQANKAAMKAMIVNRIGDVGVVIAIVICYAQYKSVEYSVIFSMATPEEVKYVGYMLLLGAVGKSAQIGLHTWLPDAMEGPTPVSALIHAATMVTAGVFLILRCSPMIEQSGSVMTSIAIVGAVTAFYAATVGIVQNDIKKVIAYSTCSQLGYMVFACGISSYSASIYHLFNHAFFKALLFLSAGSVIHAIGDEQDIRKMGSMIGRQPYTYSVMLIGSLSLMGFPYLTGYYSKDAIIEMAYGAYTIDGTFGHWLGSISAMITAFYSIRLINIVYIQDAQGDKKTYEKAHEPGMAMSIPLLVLGIASIYIGYVMRDMIIGPGAPYIEFEGGYGYHNMESEFIPSEIKWIPVVLSIAGATYAMIIYPYSSKRVIKTWYTFLSNKWHFDQIYNTVIVRRILEWGHTITYKVLDRGLIEEIGPTGIVRIVGKLAEKGSEYQSGQISQYSLGIIIGTIVLIVYNSM